MNSPTNNEQNLPEHRKDTMAILPFLRDGQDAAILIGDSVTLQRIIAQTSAVKDDPKSFPYNLKKGLAKAANEIECLNTEAEGVGRMFNSLAEDSLEKELAVTNATAAKKAAEDCYRDKVDAYNEHRTALAEEFHKAIVAVKEENTKNEITALNLLKEVEVLRKRQNNLLKQVEKLRERQNSRSVECEQKKELQEELEKSIPILPSNFLSGQNLKFKHEAKNTKTTRNTQHANAPFHVLTFRRVATLMSFSLDDVRRLPQVLII